MDPSPLIHREYHWKGSGPWPGRHWNGIRIHNIAQTDKRGRHELRSVEQRCDLIAWTLEKYLENILYGESLDK